MKVSLQLHETSHHPSLNRDLKTSICFKWPHRRMRPLSRDHPWKPPLHRSQWFFCTLSTSLRAWYRSHYAYGRFLKNRRKPGKVAPSKGPIPDTIGAFAFIPVYNRYKTKVSCERVPKGLSQNVFTNCMKVRRHWPLNLWTVSPTLPSPKSATFSKSPYWAATSTALMRNLPSSMICITPFD